MRYSILLIGLFSIACGRPCEFKVQNACVVVDALGVSKAMIETVINQTTEYFNFREERNVKFSSISEHLVIEFHTSGLNDFEDPPGMLEATHLEHQYININFEGCGNYIELSHEILHFLIDKSGICSNDDNSEHTCKDVFVQTAGWDSVEEQLACQKLAAVICK